LTVAACRPLRARAGIRSVHQSDGNTIRGLQILGFPHTGIQILGSDNVIGGDRSVGRGPVGQGNVISGNGSAGIMISGDNGGTASRNVVVGNLIGTDASGTKAMGNGMDGVWVQRGANNRIGGPGLSDTNIVSANRLNGITVSGNSTQNLIAGNHLGQTSKACPLLRTGGPGW